MSVVRRRGPLLRSAWCVVRSLSGRGLTCAAEYLRAHEGGAHIPSSCLWGIWSVCCVLFAFLLYGGCGLHDTHENAAGRQGWRDLGRQQIWMEVKVAEQTLHVPREFAWGQAASPSQGSPCVGVHHRQRLTGGGVHDTRNATPSQTSPKTIGAPACSTGVATNCFPFVSAL